MRLEVAPIGDDGVQRFVNVLATADVSGIVAWNDYGSGLVAAFDPAASGIKLKVLRSVAGGSEEPAIGVDADEQLESMLSWSKGDDGTWAYSLEGFPKYDQGAREYAYRVEEANVLIPGWHFSGYSDDSALVNEPSRLTFAVVDGASSMARALPANLGGAAFELRGDFGRVATWSCGDGNAVSVLVEDGFGAAGAGESAGWVVGLPAGEYTVRETAVPSGYRAVADFKVRLDNAGEITLLGSHDGVDLAEDGFAIVVRAIQAAPVDPGTPDDPDVPGEPSEPGGPGDPDDPDGPDSPGEPDGPEEPGTPGEPDEPGNPDGTGDQGDSDIAPFASASDNLAAAKSAADGQAGLSICGR